MSAKTFLKRHDTCQDVCIVLLCRIFHKNFLTSEKMQSWDLPVFFNVQPIQRFNLDRRINAGFLDANQITQIQSNFKKLDWTLALVTLAAAALLGNFENRHWQKTLVCNPWKFLSLDIIVMAYRTPTAVTIHWWCLILPLHSKLHIKFFIGNLTTLPFQPTYNFQLRQQTVPDYLKLGCNYENILWMTKTISPFQLAHQSERT